MIYCSQPLGDDQDILRSHVEGSHVVHPYMQSMSKYCIYLEKPTAEGITTAFMTNNI